MTSNNRTELSARSVLSVSIRIGTQIKVLRKNVSTATVPQWFKELETVVYWSGQLRGSKMKNVKVGNRGTVRSLYVQHLWNFNKWLVEQPTKIKKTTQIKENVFEQKEIVVKFKHMEELFELLTQPIPNRTTVVKMIKKYLMNTELHKNNKSTYMKTIKSSILSYFEKNDQSISVSFDPKILYASSDEAEEQQEMSLVDFMKIMTLGKPDVTEKAVFVAKFHRGLDASTLVDRFNFEVWPQLVKWFGSDDHNFWDLKKCPVITEHMRIKTSFRHPGGLDVDAIDTIPDYLNYREKKTGQIMMSGKPLFINKHNNPITLGWVFKHFFKLAKQSGVLKKLPELNAYNVDSHEARDLLKSTMIACGVAQWATDVAIGHKPDSYEKVQKLFPTKFRSEYAKCSKFINIFSKIESLVKSDDTPKDVVEQIEENFEKKLQQTKDTDQKKMDSLLDAMEWMKQEQKHTTKDRIKREEQFEDYKKSTDAKMAKFEKMIDEKWKSSKKDPTIK